MIDAPAERELVRRLQGGDGAAFDEVYRRYAPRVHGFVARLHGRRDGLEDLVQEVWVRLATHAGRLRDDTELGAWLYTVARNLVLGKHRWRLLDAERLVAFARAPRPDEPTPFDLSQATETERRLELALQALPLKYREVLLLIAVEGLTAQAAAGVLGLSPEATRQRLSRARALMQTLLEDGDG